MVGRTVSHYRVLELLVEAGPAFARAPVGGREPRRGPAEATTRTRR
jgi:hypothetical protein